MQRHLARTVLHYSMAAQGNSSNSLFSDHPSDETRISNIQGWMSEALKYYKPKRAASAVKTTKTLRVTSKKK